MTRGDRVELGSALRQWRERLVPADVGLPAGPRRRTPGLRREEVAQLAGVSVDYVIRLEQDRGPHPSESVLGALARALRLTPAETEHLFALAGVAMPGPDRVRDTVRPSVLRLLDRMQDLPAMLVGPREDMLAWNPLLTALYGDLTTVPRHRRNTLWLQFAGHPGIRRVTDEQGGTRRLEVSAVARTRAAMARYPHDRRLRATVDELHRSNPWFAELWDSRPVEHKRVDRKRYDIPGIGPLVLDCDVLEVPDDDQRLIVYSAAPGTSDADKLDLLRVVGLQRI